MAKQHILIIEDDPNISKLVQYNLENAGYDVVIAITGEAALNILAEQTIELILLDIMLPGMDGFETCKKIKQEKQFARIPIIMLTAKGEEVDRIVGLELGADDYVVKPFSPRELVLRVKAILKRQQPMEDEEEIITVGGLEIDLPRHRVRVEGNTVELTPMEFDLLLILVQRKGRVQSRDALLNNVWGTEALDITTRTVDTHIKRLRQKLGVMGEAIETVHGVGYVFREDFSCD